MRPIDIQAIGADPEVFLKDKAGKAVSVEGLLGGTKQKPVPIPGLILPGFGMQEDNVAAEFNIPPAKTAQEFTGYIHQALKGLNKVIKNYNLKLAIVPDLDFDPKYLITPQARKLGCDPDYNAWEDGFESNPTPRPPADFRTASGHLHVSWTNPDDDQRRLLVQALDLHLGVPSILVTSPNRRRSLYGMAGSFRYKPYGIEYRVLDNFWLKRKTLCSQVFNYVVMASRFLNQQSFAHDLLAFKRLEIETCINEHNVDLAHKLVKEFDLRGFNV